MKSSKKTGSRLKVLFYLLMLPGMVVAQMPGVSFNYLKRDRDLYSSRYGAFMEDTYGFIWFGSYDGGGLYRYDGYDLRPFITEPSRFSKSISGSRIAEVYPISDSVICIGTSFGFSILNTISGDVRNFNNQLDSLLDAKLGVTWAFAYDTLHGILWIGTRFGLLQLSLNELDKSIIRPAEGLSGNNRSPSEITALAIDKEDAAKLWIGSYHGLYSYVIDTGVFTHHPYLANPDGTCSVFSFYQDDAGQLCLATLEGSLLLFNKKSESWKTFALQESEISKIRPAAYALLPGFEDDLWVSTHTSVVRLNQSTSQYDQWNEVLGYPDGSLNNEGYRDLIADRHGRLWIASSYGIQYARQAFLPPSNRASKLKVAITGLQITPGYDDDPRPLLYTKPVSLRRDQRDVTFQYVLPNPINPSAVSYRYMLKGFDTDWITTDQRKIRYPRLGGGSYVFVVQAREDDNGEWLPATELALDIPRKIDEFWWFWVLIITLTGAIAILIYRGLISRARKEERMKSEFETRLSEIEMQALRAQMNPHFLFNSLNSIKYYAISKSKDETAAYLSKFAMLVRAILNNSKSRTISLKDELDALRLYIEIEHLRLEERFDYTIDIDSSIHVGQAQIPPMILQPYVENALWHGLMHKEGRGRLLVQVRDLGNQIQCIIEDNGVGRAKAAEMKKAQLDHKKSVGMQITSDRISLINKIYNIDTQLHVIDLKDSEGNAMGTRVVINIPLIGDEEE